MDSGKQREGFASRLGFILVSAGCAVGIGNVWRFPTVTGQNGGSLIYLLFCVTRWGWNFDNYLAECNTGSGFKMPCWLKNYFRFALPVLILVILVQGL